jgi:hypothetical protein
MVDSGHIGLLITLRKMVTWKLSSGSAKMADSGLQMLLIGLHGEVTLKL